MANISISEIRKKYPDYSDLSDQELADKLHSKFYSDVPKNEFYSKIGVNNVSQEPINSILENVASLPRGVLSGIWKGTHEILNAPHNITKLFSEEAAKKVPYKAVPEYREALGAIGEAGIPEKISEFAGEILPALLMPEASLGAVGAKIASIPKVGKFAQKALGQAVPQGGYSAAISEDPLESGLEASAMTLPFTAISQLAASSSPALRILAKGTGGLLGGLIGHETAKGIGASDTGQDLAAAFLAAMGSRGFQTKKGMMEKLTKGIEGGPVEERLAASNRLGLSYLTPAEASLNPFLANRQATLGRTPEGMKLFYERGQERTKSEESAINNLLDTVYKEEAISPKVTANYDIANPKELPAEVISSLGQDEIIKAARKNVEKKPAYKQELKNVPKNTIEYWDKVKKSLDDMVNSAERQGNKEEAKILSDSRRKLRDAMDVVSPEYREGRQLSERKHAREAMEKAFNTKEVTGTNFYQLIKNDKVFDKIMFSLRNVPEAQAMLTDMRLLFKDLLSAPTIKTASALERTGMNQERNDAKSLENIMKHIFTGGKRDKAAIDFITSPNWNEKLKEIEQISNKHEKSQALINLMGKVVSQKTAKRERSTQNE